MAIEVMTMVWKTQGHFTSAEKIIMLYIADRGNYEGKHSYPSLNTLAKKCELNVATVKRCLNRLCDKGILTRAYRISENGDLTSNSYSINIKLLENFVDNPVDKACIKLIKI